jgi:glycerophosphoryl diester phosphodiesterase
VVPAHPFFDALSPTLHVSHRGGAALAPENTLVAFRSAVGTWRTQMLELDVQASRDGVLVVTHDPTLERTTDGEGRVADHGWAELRRLDAGYRFTRDGRTFPFRGQGVRLCRLEDVLAEFPSVRLNVELKPESEGAVDLFASAVRSARAEHRVCCGSESDRVGAKLHRALPECCHFYPRDALTAAVMAFKMGVEPPPEERYLVLDMPLAHEGMVLVDAELVRRAAAHGRWVNVWTVDDPEDMRRLVAGGAGGIMTDRPDLLRAVLGD